MNGTLCAMNVTPAARRAARSSAAIVGAKPLCALRFVRVRRKPGVTMILQFLLMAASAAAPTPIEAERAYAALAQTRGQWTAFRATAAPDALMFVPEPVRAAQWLAGRADPPVPVIWWPARGWLSCDGRLGVNFGPWIRKAGALVGTFTTVWVRGGDGAWKWRLDRGDVGRRPVAASDRPAVRRASCRRLAAARLAPPGPADPDVLASAGDAPLASVPDFTRQSGDRIDSGASPDGSLRWEVRALDGHPAGAHLLRVWRWDGRVQRLALIQATDPAD
jgi:hypothetical protein